MSEIDWLFVFFFLSFGHLGGKRVGWQTFRLPDRETQSVDFIFTTGLVTYRSKGIKGRNGTRSECARPHSCESNSRESKYAMFSENGRVISYEPHVLVVRTDRTKRMYVNMENRLTRKNRLFKKKKNDKRAYRRAVIDWFVAAWSAVKTRVRFCTGRRRRRRDSCRPLLPSCLYIYKKKLLFVRLIAVGLKRVRITDGLFFFFFFVVGPDTTREKQTIMKRRQVYAVTANTLYTACIEFNNT